MIGIKHLLLLAAFVLLARCQQPKVSMSPALKQIFSGDLFFLTCDTGSSESGVKWYFNDMEQMPTNNTWRIGVASPMHSGSYQCESNRLKSETFPISVLDYVPSASLTIRTGQPVVKKGGTVVLQLENEDGLQGWICWVYTGRTTLMIKLRINNDTVSLPFQPNRLTFPENIFWCDNNQQRSNQVTVRTSDKKVSLEMYPLPAVVGESLTLRCLAWGTDKISHTVFYKDNAEFKEGDSPTHKISNVTESAKGKYKCHATFTYRARTAGPPYRVTSDDQEVFVQVPPIKAVIISANTGMSCSCPLCPSDSNYRWYHKVDSAQWTPLHSSQEFMKPKESGTYACKAVWQTGKSYISNGYNYKPPIITILIGVITVLAILILAAVVIYFWHSRRNHTEQIYEDMPLTSRDKDDGGYEQIQKGAKREAEYDTLNPEVAGRQTTEGQYEALKKEKMTEGEYQTLGTEGATGGEGGYQALKKGGMKEEVYHTLGMEGATGGEGGYQALKKEGMKEGEYQTLGTEGATGGEGGYQALKKEGLKEGVYHTLGMEGAVGGEGGYQALKIEGKKEGVYHTLGKEGAGGGE